MTNARTIAGGAPAASHRARRDATPPFVAIGGGHELFVRDWGVGAPVLLLAGWAMDSRIWGETTLALNACGLRTIAYDRRGHGRSSDPGEVDYDNLADDLAAILDALDLSGVTLVCHSGAAGEAIRYLTRHGHDRVERLVLVGATGPKMAAGVDDPSCMSCDMVDALQTQIATDPAAGSTRISILSRRASGRGSTTG